jgi:polyisoprenoid-binding protein YceI
LKVIRVLLLVAVVAVGGGFAYIYFSGGSGEPSTELTPPEIDGSTTEGAFVIVPEESVASFQLGEVLFGEDMTVIGSTSEVAGQLLFDPADPGSAQLSEILINARTFETNKSNRDRAMRSGVVLDSGSVEHEFISFVPTSVQGLDGPVAPGDEVSFEVGGDLTIKGTTLPVTFTVSALFEAADRITGRAEAQVERSDFGIGIPNAPGVANVTEDVTITLDFVAVQA